MTVSRALLVCCLYLAACLAPCEQRPSPKWHSYPFQEDPRYSKAWNCLYDEVKAATTPKLRDIIVDRERIQAKKLPNDAFAQFKWCIATYCAYPQVLFDRERYMPIYMSLIKTKPPYAWEYALILFTIEQDLVMGYDCVKIGQKLVGKFPNDVSLLSRFAVATGGRPGEVGANGIAMMKKCIRLQPGKIRFRYMLAGCLYFRYKSTKSKAVLKAAIEEHQRLSMDKSDIPNRMITQRVLEQHLDELLRAQGAK